MLPIKIVDITGSLCIEGRLDSSGNACIDGLAAEIRLNHSKKLCINDSVKLAAYVSVNGVVFGNGIRNVSICNFLCPLGYLSLDKNENVSRNGFICCISPKPRIDLVVYLFVDISCNDSVNVVICILRLKAVVYVLVYLGINEVLNVTVNKRLNILVDLNRRILKISDIKRNESFSLLGNSLIKLTFKDRNDIILNIFSLGKILNLNCTRSNDGGEKVAYVGCECVYCRVGIRSDKVFKEVNVILRSSLAVRIRNVSI